MADLGGMTHRRGPRGIEIMRRWDPRVWRGTHPKVKSSWELRALACRSVTQKTVDRSSSGRDDTPYGIDTRWLPGIDQYWRTMLRPPPTALLSLCLRFTRQTGGSIQGAGPYVLIAAAECPFWLKMSPSTCGVTKEQQSNSWLSARWL